MRQHRMLTIGMTITSIAVACALLAPIILPADPYAQNLPGRLMPPGTQGMYYARTVRGETLSIKRLEFVEAARAMGASHLHIISRAIPPMLCRQY